MRAPRMGWPTWREDACGLGVIALLAGAVWLLVVEPGADARDQCALLRSKTDLVRSQIAMIQTQSRAALTDLEAATLDAGSTLPLRPASDFNRVLASLNQAALESGIMLDQLNPGDVERTEETTRFRLSIAGRGSYPAAVTFLSLLRTQFPDVTVLALSATRGSTDTQGAALLSLDLAWHAQPDRPPNRSAH